MQRISQLSSHLAKGAVRGSASESTSTPHQADRNIPTDTNSIMTKTKVVVTRRLIDEAQNILDAKKSELEVVQWNSEKVQHPVQYIRVRTTN
jgi:hypothetical protein